jgi:hypothetical protein
MTALTAKLVMSFLGRRFATNKNIKLININCAKKLDLPFNPLYEGAIVFSEHQSSFQSNYS